MIKPVKGQENQEMKALQSSNYRKLKRKNPNALQKWMAGKSDIVKEGEQHLRIVPVRPKKKTTQ
jgi:hypothetical protein